MIYNVKKYLSVGKIERENQRLTVPQVIEALKDYNITINKQTLYNYENGTSDMPVSILTALANIYNCRLDDLIYPVAIAPLKTENVRYDVHLYDASKNLTKENKYNYIYDPQKNRFDHHDQMVHAIFTSDDMDTGFLEGTRVIYRKTGDIKFKISETYNYYLIGVTELIDHKEITKSIFTKAKIIKNSVTPRIVQYFYQGHVLHMAEKSFMELVEGIVVKVIYDRDMKKTEGAFFY